MVPLHVCPTFGSCRRARKEGSTPPFWEVFAKALTESSDEEGQAELDAAEAAAARIEAEIREAETSWQPVRDPFLCAGYASIYRP